jgi:hypothetical protein
MLRGCAQNLPANLQVGLQGQLRNVETALIPLASQDGEHALITEVSRYGAN